MGRLHVAMTWIKKKSKTSVCQWNGGSNADSNPCRHGVRPAPLQRDNQHEAIIACDMNPKRGVDEDGDY